ncbi:hypothetical protein BU23DRAFT_654205 [Bimuria novae-zelandiae CBS 107.79]|uniref:SWI5-dependent HO expression protein 3 n=1 Tax=Bimuria novae-zelandiae CBS 107.79 TaxID=1447943 RepID=A0A6A5VK12_9PLEO|nr:hypothetical protein BU23DRAFT_654205 [Bimuria novae-zelandiae CBS 107.79]
MQQNGLQAEVREFSSMCKKNCEQIEQLKKDTETLQSSTSPTEGRLDGLQSNQNSDRAKTASLQATLDVVLQRMEKLEDARIEDRKRFEDKLESVVKQRQAAEGERDQERIKRQETESQASALEDRTKALEAEIISLKHARDSNEGCLTDLAAFTKNLRETAHHREEESAKGFGELKQSHDQQRGKILEQEAKHAGYQAYQNQNAERIKVIDRQTAGLRSTVNALQKNLETHASKTGSLTTSDKMSVTGPRPGRRVDHTRLDEENRRNQVYDGSLMRGYSNSLTLTPNISPMGPPSVTPSRCPGYHPMPSPLARLTTSRAGPSTPSRLNQ